MTSVLKDIVGEVHGNTASGIHPTVLALVDGFLVYLREPRYQNPLLLDELARLFQSFYGDLNSLVINIYTQLNTNKRQLLQKSHVFNSDPDTFDYLVAIANYSSSSIKLVKRTDPQALKQLRVFAFYKFLTILDTIEKAQYDLFSASSPGDRSTLYDKIFRFDERDIKSQTLLSEKIRVLRNLNLPYSCFCDTADADEKARLDEFFLTFHVGENATLERIQNCLRLLNQVRTPSAKLKHIVKIQKLLIILLSAFYDNDPSKVNNDVLLPSLIYIIIYHLPGNEALLKEDTNASEPDYDLYLNFTFVKTFLNLIDPYYVDCSTFTLGSSLLFYNPTDKKRSQVRNNKVSTNLYELLNLSESPNEEKDDSDSVFLEAKELENDHNLINYIQLSFLNNGEHQYYLTNFEAILFFLLNTPIQELVPEDFTIPEGLSNNRHITMGIHDIIDLDKKNKPVEEEAPLDDEVARLAQEELDGTRTRSSSLFNTITSAVSHQVNRSRSNSSALKSPTKEVAHDFEASLYTSPLASSDRVDHYGLGRVRNLLGRLGLVSSMQVRPPTLDEETISISGDTSTEILTDARTKRSLSLFDKLSPSHPRTRSGSLEAGGTGLIPSNSGPRRATLSTKFSNGVTEFMTKLSTAAVVNAPIVDHVSNASSHSLEEASPFEEHGQAKRPEFVNRTSSLQTMDRWFNNITGTSTDAALNHQPSSSNASNQFTTGDSNFNEGSVFSASFGELTRYQHTDFESLTINDLKTLKGYYDQLCSEVMSAKTGSKTSNEFLSEDDKEQPAL